MKKPVKITLLSIAGVLLICLVATVVIYKLPVRYSEKFQAYTLDETYTQPVSVELELEASYALLGEDSITGTIRLNGNTDTYTFQPQNYEWRKRVLNHMMAQLSLEPHWFNWDYWIPAEQAGTVTNYLAASGDVYEYQGKFCLTIPVDDKSTQFYFGPAENQQEAEEIYRDYFLSFLT